MALLLYGQARPGLHWGHPPFCLSLSAASLLHSYVCPSTYIDWYTCGAVCTVLVACMVVPLVHGCTIQCICELHCIQDMGSECGATGWIWCPCCNIYLSMYLSLPQATAGLLFYLLKAQPIVTFYKLNVHAGELSLGRKVEGGELFQMSLNNSGNALLWNQIEWHNSLLCIHKCV